MRWGASRCHNHLFFFFFLFFTLRLSGILLLAKQQTLVHTETPFFPPPPFFFFPPLLLFFPLFFVKSLSFCLCGRAAPLATLYMYLERILEAYLYLAVGLLSFCLLRLKLVCTLPKRGVRRQTTTTTKKERTKEKSRAHPCRVDTRVSTAVSASPECFFFPSLCLKVNGKKQRLRLKIRL